MQTITTIYGMLFAFKEMQTVTKKYTVLDKAQLKDKFTAYIWTWWQLENLIQNKNHFRRVVIVLKLGSPNHVLEIIFQMPKAVVSYWKRHIAKSR